LKIFVFQLLVPEKSTTKLHRNEEFKAYCSVFLRLNRVTMLVKARRPLQIKINKLLQ